MKILGVDFGGSGIKAAPINTKTGELLYERYRLETPQPSTPEAVTQVVHELVKHFQWTGPIGMGFPAVIQQGIARTAANIDKSWIGVNVNRRLSESLKLPLVAVNDADAAGMAEMKFGAGRGFKGTVLLLTVGTGIGTVLFSKGKLIPNTELGHIIYKGADAELYVSDTARKRDNLEWEAWADRFNGYLAYMESLFWPDVIIIGGGVSKKTDRFWSEIKSQVKIVPAQLQNDAGLVGAALYAKSMR